jgi:DNA gyrase subunit A
VREGDILLEAKLTNGNHEILMAIKSGKAIRFNESKVRPMGRNASGVKAVTLLDEQDEVVGMVCIEDGNRDILVVSEHGYGKRSAIEDYRVTNRGGKGVKTISVTDKTGALVAIKSVTDEEDLIIINKSGVMIRMAVADLRVMGRATQGVRLINIKGSDRIASVTNVPANVEDELIDENNTEASGEGSVETPPTE